MGKRVVKVWDVQSSGVFAALVILAAAFLLGSLAGCLLVQQSGGEGSEALADYLQSYLSAAVAQEMPKPDWFSTLWDTIRWPLLAVALGLTPLGLLGIPIVFFARGFLLSFAVASFFHVLGGLGLAFAFVVFGVVGIICIPVLFFLGVQGFLCAGTLAGRLLGESKKQSIPDRVFLLRCGVCAAALFVCCFLEYSVIPVLIQALAGFLPA